MVTAHLRTVLRPDPAVVDVVAELGERFLLAAVTSSALSRLDACLEVTGLTALFPTDRRFVPRTPWTGRPAGAGDPAVYLVAGRAFRASRRTRGSRSRTR